MIRQLLPGPADLPDRESLEDFYLCPPGRHVRADFVVSLDGAVEIGGRSGPLGAPEDKEAFMAMRAVADAIMVGAGTVRIEHYGPVSVPPESQERRVARGQLRVPPLVIVSRRGLLDPGDRVFSGGHRPILVTTGAALAERPELVDVADVLECGDEDVDLVRALDQLAARGLGRIDCEGGPTLLHSLLTHELVDEVCVTFSPLIAGPQHLQLSGGTPLVSPVSLRLESLLEGGGLLIARYSTTGDGE